YQRRDSSNANNFVNNWTTERWTADTPNSFVNGGEGVIINNAPAVDQLYSRPSDLRYEVQDNKRERSNVQAVVQFKPVEQLTATLDYTFSELDRVSDRAQQSVWFNQDAISELTFDDGAVKTPILYHEQYFDRTARATDDNPYTNPDDVWKDTSGAASQLDSLTQNISVGLYLSYEVNDQLTFTLDYHRSSAENLTTITEMGLNANVVTSEFVDWSREMPLMSITIDDCHDRVRGAGATQQYVN